MKNKWYYRRKAAKTAFAMTWIIGILITMILAFELLITL